MKKKIMMLVVMLAAFIGSMTLNSGKALAEDVWAYSDEYGTTYVIAETITNAPEDVSVKVKKVQGNRVVGINEIIFDKTNMTWVAQTGTGFRNLGPISNSRYATAVWNVVKPRLRK